MVKQALHPSFAVIQLYFLFSLSRLKRLDYPPNSHTVISMPADQEPTVALGKHSREASPDAEDGPQMPAADVDDSSDEEIGPMPVPESVNGGENKSIRKKKKRAGEFSSLLSDGSCKSCTVRDEGYGRDRKMTIGYRG